MTDPDVQQYPKNNVGNQHHIDIGRTDQNQVEQHEEDINGQNGAHGCAVAHAQGQELVVDMRLVRQEGTLVPADTAQHHPQHVEAGNHQHGEGHHQRLRNVAHAHYAVHAETDGNDRKNQTNGETAAVAHENLAPVLGLTEDVEIEEHGQRAQRCRRYHGGHLVEPQHKEAAKEEKSHHAQARRQAVDAVNQVDGIDDEDDEQHRQRIGHPLRQLMHAKEAVEVVEIYPGSHDEAGTDKLEEELHPVAHAHEVVGDAHHIEKHDGTQQRGHLRLRRQRHAVHVDRQRMQPHQQGHAQDDGRRESQTAQARHNTAVHLAGIDHIEQSLLKGNQDDLRNHQRRDNGTKQESKTYVNNKIHRASIFFKTMASFSASPGTIPPACAFQRKTPTAAAKPTLARTGTIWGHRKTATRLKSKELRIRNLLFAGMSRIKCIIILQLHTNCLSVAKIRFFPNIQKFC